ncbi:hypothetical protein G7046_g4484 [Stylonectria norvegica]|nr:hypothetical protein G7046_g4484 [Stylonectria norvegica]
MGELAVEDVDGLPRRLRGWRLLAAAVCGRWAAGGDGRQPEARRWMMMRQWQGKRATRGWDVGQPWVLVLNGMRYWGNNTSGCLHVKTGIEGGFKWWLPVVATKAVSVELPSYMYKSMYPVPVVSNHPCRRQRLNQRGRIPPVYLSFEPNAQQDKLSTIPHETAQGTEQRPSSRSYAPFPNSLCQGRQGEQLQHYVPRAVHRLPGKVIWLLFTSYISDQWPADNEVEQPRWRHGVNPSLHQKRQYDGIHCMSKGERASMGTHGTSNKVLILPQLKAQLQLIDSGPNPLALTRTSHRRAFPIWHRSRSAPSSSGPLVNLLEALRLQNHHATTPRASGPVGVKTRGEEVGPTLVPVFLSGEAEVTNYICPARLSLPVSSYKYRIALPIRPTAALHGRWRTRIVMMHGEIRTRGPQLGPTCCLVTGWRQVRIDLLLSLTPTSMDALLMSEPLLRSTCVACEYLAGTVAAVVEFPRYDVKYAEELAA